MSQGFSYLFCYEWNWGIVIVQICSDMFRYVQTMYHMMEKMNEMKMGDVFFNY